MHRRCFLKVLPAVPAASFVSEALVHPAHAQQRGRGFATPAEPFKPIDAPNAPLGAGKGIHPGRVVWAHEPAAARWDGKTGDWWDDANTDQALVSKMVSSTIRSLAGKTSDKA